MSENEFKQEFKKRMFAMAEMWDYEFPQENGKSTKVRLYYERLKNMPLDAFIAASNRLVDSFTPTAAKKFPVPADFLAAVGMDEESIVNNAVRKVKEASSSEGAYKSVNFGDRALHAVIRSNGGWVAVSRWSDDEWQYNERKFRDAYASARRVKDEGPNYLPGIFELENSGRTGAEKYIPLPAPIHIPGLPQPQRAQIEHKKDEPEELGDTDGIIADIIKNLERIQQYETDN